MARMRKADRVWEAKMERLASQRRMLEACDRVAAIRDLKLHSDLTDREICERIAFDLKVDANELYTKWMCI